MSDHSEGHEVKVEMPLGSRPRVLVDGQDVTDQAVGPDGSVSVNQPGMSMRIQAGSWEGTASPPPSLPAAGVTPRSLEATSDDAGAATQKATVIQTQTVNVSAGGAVTIFLSQNAQVSQNQANRICKRRQRRHC